MSILWQDIADSLQRWVEDATGLRTVWREEERPFTKSLRDKAIAMLHIVSTRSRGVDDIRGVDNLDAAPASNIDTTLCGMREFTLSVQVESFSQKPNDAARCFLEEARTRLRLPSVLGKLQSNGLALIETMPTVLLDRIVDDHMISRANMDVRFSVAENQVDEPIQSIESTLVSSSLKAPDGTLLPTPPNLLDKEMP
jgi:hypothetical protein